MSQTELLSRITQTIVSFTVSEQTSSIPLRKGNNALGESASQAYDFSLGSSYKKIILVAEERDPPLT